MRAFIFALAALSAAACGAGEGTAPAAVGREAPPAARNVLLFLGDSLTAGYGVTGEEAYPALLAERWRAEGLSYRARNAGVSGTTTAGVLESLDWHLSEDVYAVFLCIGANDGLRGQDLRATRQNIDAIIRKVQASGRRLILAGMRIPPNYGPAYSEQFAAIFPDLAQKHGLSLMPFLLDGVGGRAAMNIADGIHPNAEGHKVIAQNVQSFLSREGILK